jgi:hypothetical protein
LKFIRHHGVRHRDLIAKPLLIMAKSNLLGLTNGANGVLHCPQISDFPAALNEPQGVLLELAVLTPRIPALFFFHFRISL